MATSNQLRARLAVPKETDITPLPKGIQDAYANGEYTDAVVVCKGIEWKVHRVVLCERSEFFRKAFGGQFKEGLTNRLELPDNEPQTVDAMLCFIYKLDYNDERNSDYLKSAGSPDALVLNMRVFTIADKYFIPGLKRHAEDKFRKRAEAEWSSPAFAAAISELYRSGSGNDDSLRLIILAVVREHAGTLLTEATKYGPFNAVYYGVGEFSAEVGKTLAITRLNEKSKFSGSVGFKCPACNLVFRELNASVFLSCPNGCYSSQSRDCQSRDWWNRQHIVCLHQSLMGVRD